MFGISIFHNCDSEVQLSIETSFCTSKTLNPKHLFVRAQ